MTTEHPQRKLDALYYRLRCHAITGLHMGAERAVPGCLVALGMIHDATGFDFRYSLPVVDAILDDLALTASAPGAPDLSFVTVPLGAYKRIRVDEAHAQSAASLDALRAALALELDACASAQSAAPPARDADGRVVTCVRNIADRRVYRASISKLTPKRVFLSSGELRWTARRDDFVSVGVPSFVVDSGSFGMAVLAASGARS